MDIFERRCGVSCDFSAVYKSLDQLFMLIFVIRKGFCNATHRNSAGTPSTLADLRKNTTQVDFVS